MFNKTDLTNCSLANHQLQQIAILLVNEWERLDQFKELHPTQTPDYVTLVQCLGNISASRVANILNMCDDEYLTKYNFTRSKYRCARSLILTGKL